MNRLKKFLIEFITNNQSGFLPGRQLRDNVRYIINTIELYDKNPDKEVVWFFINAEKAFDNIKMEFIVSVMEKLDLGTLITNAIQAIYKDQLAGIKINNNTSKFFKIFKGTRQRCPLFPLLFIMAIKVLLIKIREDKSIRGLKNKKYHYKVHAFADDLVFILEGSLRSISKVIQAIEEFGKVAGFYLNQSKSKLLTKNIQKENTEKIKQIVD